MKINASSPIKSIQRGIASRSGSSDGDVTISTVDPEKTVVNLTNSDGGYSYGARLHLKDANTLTIYARTSSSNNTGLCYWEVIEYV